MSDRPPSAVLRSPLDHKRRLSLIWAIPVVTLLIGAWLAWQTISERGPLVTITFETAEGLQAHQSHVRHKDVDMGVVQKIALTPDLRRVQVTVRMNKEAEPLLTDKAQFWVVRPRFFAGSISGLSTLISGSYIALLPSEQGGEPKRDFVGLENPPVLQSDVPGRTFLLQTKSIGGLTLGSPITFRDLDVGEVLGWDVGEMARNVAIHIFVRAPFDKYVRDDSRFWNTSGASVQLGAHGLEFKVESLRSMVLGGIAFETPDEPENMAEAEPNRQFILYPSKDAADASLFKRSVPFVANFTTSVSGLTAGSPVMLLGLKIGEVSSVSLVYDRSADNVVVPVHFTLVPERIAMLNLPTDGDLDTRIRELIRRGLRVKLETANILTGQKQLDMDMFANAGPAEYRKQGDAYVIPALGGGGEDVATAATNLVNRLNSIPFESIGQNLNQTLAGASALVSNKQLEESLAALHSTLASTQELVNSLNQGVSPMTKRLPTIATGLEDAVNRTNRLLDSLQAGYGSNSQLSRDVNRLMAQLSDATQSIRVLADLLSRHPEALIRGRSARALE
jgi:paraquat-inducible protein B